MCSACMVGMCVGSACNRWGGSAQVPDNAFVFMMDPDLVPMVNAASQLTRGDLGGLLEHAAAAWRTRGERHAVVVPALQVSQPHPGLARSCAQSLHAIKADSECWLFDNVSVPARTPTLRRMAMERYATGYLAAEVRAMPMHDSVRLLNTHVTLKHAVDQQCWFRSVSQSEAWFAWHTWPCMGCLVVVFSGTHAAGQNSLWRSMHVAGWV